MDLIHQNPFRILGLNVTATDREFVKSISDLSIFMEMGKTKEFDCDHFFPAKPYRTSESIHNASQKIEQPNNKLFYALFWFWENPDNTVDEMAFEVLKKGNTAKAIQFWKQSISGGMTDANSSNYKNLAALFLGLSCSNGKIHKGMFLKGVALSGKYIARGNFQDFAKHVIGPKHSIDLMEIVELYVDQIITLAKPYLDKEDGLETKELIKSFSYFPEEIKDAFLGKFIGKHVYNINRQIENSQRRRERVSMPILFSASVTS